MSKERGASQDEWIESVKDRGRRAPRAGKSLWESPGVGKGFAFCKTWKKASVERVFGEKGREELERFAAA